MIKINSNEIDDTNSARQFYVDIHCQEACLENRYNISEIMIGPSRDGTFDFFFKFNGMHSMSNHHDSHLKVKLKLISITKRSEGSKPIAAVNSVNILYEYIYLYKFFLKIEQFEKINFDDFFICFVT